MIRVLIVDDEAPARRKVERFLREHDDIEILGEAANGSDAIAMVRERRPDVVFLDVQMPDIDGLEVAEVVATLPHVPRIVFVTAHDTYALRAFDLSALDYLLKPFDRERFDRALDRARTSHGSNTDAQIHLAALIEGFRPPGTYLRRLLVPSDERSFFLPVGEIVRLEAERNNVLIHARGTAYTIRATLESLTLRLDPEQFARVHRSHVVNIDAINEVHPWFHGDQQIVLRDGTTIPWSRRFAAKRPDLLP